MLAPITSAGIILSYKCNSRCRHCLYSCGPEWKDWIDAEDGRRILEGMIAAAGRVRGVHFAGGEAFLDFSKLLALVKTANRLRIPIDYVETNAGWCVDDTSSREKLIALRDAGLRCLLVSASPFHAEHIPPERPLRAVELGAEVFGPYSVIIWLPEFLNQIIGIRRDSTIPFEEFAQRCGPRAVSHAVDYGGAMVPGGRAGLRLKDYHTLLPAEAFYNETCRHELLNSGTGHFDLYGNYLPASCTGIAIQDARDLPAMMETFRLEDHPIMEMLCNDGVGKLVAFARDRLGFQPSSDGYAGKCHLCVDARRAIALATDEFPELAPKGFYEYL